MKEFLLGALRRADPPKRSAKLRESLSFGGDNYSPKGNKSAVSCVDRLVPRVAIALSAVPFVIAGAAGGALVLRERPAPPPPITLIVSSDPPRTVTVAEPVPAVVLIPSTDGPAPVPDLDGDGVPEQLETQPDTCGTGGCLYDLYLSSAPGKAAGRIEGKWGYWSATPRRDAFADFHTTWHLGCCEIEELTYRYRGGAYREIKRVASDPRRAP
jgi:hypothetical protein